MGEQIGTDDDRAPTPRFLVVDRRVPEPIRHLLEEADGCLNMSFTVGGSACVRRAIRTAFELESVDGGDFSANLVALAQKHQGVAPTLFQVIDVLGAGEAPLNPDALKALIATFKGVLYEVYVLGEERAESLAYLSKLLEALDRQESPKLPKTRAGTLPSKPRS